MIGDIERVSLCFELAKKLGRDHGAKRGTRSLADRPSDEDNASTHRRLQLWR